jgi:hypothetical protein
MMVVPGQDFAVGEMPRGMANYYDVPGANAFRNFRQLLEDNAEPDDGQYLSVMGNDKGMRRTILTRTTLVR